MRDIRREFAASSASADPDESITSELYGKSAEFSEGDSPDDTFGATLARIKSQASPLAPVSGPRRWRSAIFQALLDDVIVPRRPDHLGEPSGGYFSWEIKQAEKLNHRWAEARLNGLAGENTAIIKWIRLSARQEVAAPGA